MAGKYSIDQASYADAAYVVLHARKEDSLGTPQGGVKEVLQKVFRVSRDTVYAVKVEGVPLCIFGVAEATLLSGAATPWVVGTPEMRRHSTFLLRASRKILKVLLKEFGSLRSRVHRANTESIRWLQWLGFDVYCYEEDHSPYYFCVKGG